MAEYFKLGSSTIGNVFFVPDGYKKSIQTIGSDVRRSINGTARRDVITYKHHFELSFSCMDEYEYNNFLSLYLSFINGSVLTFVDDEEDSYRVIWAGDFGIEDRLQEQDIFWSGTITLEEV